MTTLKLVDYLFLYSIISIWVLLFFNIILTLSGYRFFKKLQGADMDIHVDGEALPTVSILIPAHNEGVVIGKTMEAMLNLDYPVDKLEIIVINDNSSDNTGEILEYYKVTHSDRKIKIITTDPSNGGKGKSNALNIGYQNSDHEILVVYDADNTPEKLAVRYLVAKLMSDDIYGAAVGKFRTRNKNKNLLTQFINIETLSFQWMAQAGRYQLYNLCTIPGTNFAVRRNVIEALGGWDVDAIAEDTEISFRIYDMGYIIGFIPLAVTWEQEPETLKVWVKQRTRWVSGNIYVLIKNFKNLFIPTSKKTMVDLYYFFTVYFLFFSSVVVSDTIFMIGLFTDVKVTLYGNFVIIWLLSYAMFILEVSIALSMEKGETNAKNVGLVILMYFTYCQLWLFVTIKGFYRYFHDVIFKRQVKWYKTERF